jgi:hypothetical protein
MANGGKVKRFLLFSALTDLQRKGYVGSFRTLDEAVREAKARKTSAAMRWQVMDRETLKVLAEDPGKDGQPLETPDTVDS